MDLWKYAWFISLIAWCRKWNWFDTYVYGKSVDLEDFVRNPAEVLRDTYFPFIIKSVKAYSLLNIRVGYISALNAPDKKNCWLVPMGDRKFIWEGKQWVYIDARLFNPWYTKFCNAIIFFQIAVSIWHNIPVPYISACVKIGSWYMQVGLGWGAETTGNAVLCAKLRFVNEKTSNEAILNPSDVLGYYEGTI